MALSVTGRNCLIQHLFDKEAAQRRQEFQIGWFADPIFLAITLPR